MIRTVAERMLQAAEVVLPARFRDLLARASLKIATEPYKLHKQYVDMFWAIRNLRRLGFSPTTVVDVGAFSGDWSEQVQSIFPDATFLLVEPLPTKQEGLNARVRRPGRRWILEQAIAGRKPAPAVPFYSMGTGSSVLEEQSTFERALIHVPMVPLDDLVGRHHLRGEYFLKMDVQGYELEVLRGAPRTMEQTHFILLETSLLDCNKDAPLVGDVFQFLSERGFVLFDVCDTHRKRNDHVLCQVDLLFVRKTSELRRRVNDFKDRAFITG